MSLPCTSVVSIRTISTVEPDQPQQEMEWEMTFTWLRDFDEAVAAARKQRKPIMIDVYQDN